MGVKNFGVMLDMSRNAVMKPDAVKKFVDYISSFGYNVLQLYTEDTYVVDNEPYFGYLRGGYTKQEIREINEYCKQKGVELIPCIQTLAHLNAIFKWQEYQKINDIADILLIDEPRTYTLIENMFKTIKDCFSSRKIHIGMDEAHLVGLGKYLDKHGICNRHELINKHLAKIVEIAKKYGFEPMMWSDMFFRLANKGEYCVKNTEFPKEIIDGIPDVDLVYWDYYHTHKSDYRSMIKAHKQMGKEIWFAGGAWSWVGFAPANRHSLSTMKPAMQVCKEEGVENIFITMWGDNGKECSFFTLLPSLYAIKRYYDGVTDRKQIAKEFEKLVGEPFERMIGLDDPNYVGGNKEGFRNQSKYMLYNDPFFGVFDTICKEGVPNEYKGLARRYSAYAKKSQGFGYIYDFMSKLCKALSLKYDLGVRVRSAYKKNNKEELADIATRMKMVEKTIKALYKSFNCLWYTENKPHGFDVQDIRFGGLIQRLKSCRERLLKYIDSTVEQLPELEEVLLNFWENGEEYCKDIPVYNCWALNATVNVI